ncbi:GlxA family transcriptional regulator [Nocardia vaccinii]|uniref:GlxA family transcriptional regulator n=1 Tax=Nocardia vaccinii TaxID=1822 RepID=UPI000834F08E|nr:helix-turn-helix domain-containing protein [Nocardia vaccinii]
MPHVLALAVSEQVGIFELAAPCAIFGTDRSEFTRGRGWYDFRVCASGTTAVDQWFVTATQHTYEQLIEADTVVVPACHDLDLTPPPDLVDALRQAHRRGARVVSLCTGAFVLAAAGLLDDRRATTHWLHAETLARRHPRVEVDPNVLYVDEGRVLTSAGKSAAMDLCLYLVAKDYGATVANTLARRLVTPPHRDGGQAQYIPPPAMPSTPGYLDRAVSFALGNLHRPIGIDDLARHAGVSVRTLHRRFRSQLGTNPQTWLHRQRLARAQELLERTDHTVDRIAQDSGFGTAHALRRHFHAVLHTTPDAYRKTWEVGR